MGPYGTHTWIYIRALNTIGPAGTFDSIFNIRDVFMHLLWFRGGMDSLGLINYFRHWKITMGPYGTLHWFLIGALKIMGPYGTH